MRFFRGLTMVGCVVVVALLAGVVVEHLWNWLMPTIFGFRVITYWQAFGLLLLSKILLGGFHRHGGGRGGFGRGGWRHRMHERWEKMSPEERERFRAGMKGRRGCDWGRGFGGGFEDRGGEAAQTEKV